MRILPGEGARVTFLPGWSWRLRAVLASLLLLAAAPAGLGAEPWDISPTELALIEQRHGAPARAKVGEWLELIRAHREVTEREKLEAVNRFFNGLRFRSDAELWNAADYWATPLEFLTAGGGDCEDFSIAKYFTLKALGVAPQRLRLTYVRALLPNPVSQAHMVLGYYEHEGDEPLILDNLLPDIRPAAQRADLVPVYSFNSDGLWLAKLRGQGQRVGDASRVGPWENLVQRMRGIWDK